MIPIYYKSSEGEIVNLIETPYRMLTDTELLNSEWKITTTGENFPRITRLDKELVSPPFKIRVTGQTKEAMYNNLEHLEGVFDRDCFLNQMGRLYIGDFYRECFITSTTHGKVFEKNHTVVQFVATSNNGLWTNDKDFALSGYGMPTGEIAYTVTPTATPNNYILEWSANDDKTASIKWDSGIFGEPKALVFDMGSENYIERFRGIHIGGTTSPASCSVQTWDGESTVSESKSSTMSEASLPLPVPIYNPYEFPYVYSTRSYWWTVEDDIFQVKATSVPSGVNIVMVGSKDGTNYEAVDIYTSQVDLRNQMIDVSRFDTIIFYAFSREEVEQTMTLNFTQYGRDWQEIDSFTSSPNQTVEIDVEDFTTRYLRLYSQYYFGIIDDDSVSFYSGNEIVPKDLFGLGYTTENIEVLPYDDDSGRVNFKLIDERKGGYLYFDAQSFILKKITSSPRSASSDGSIVIWGENDGEWELILDLESASEISEDFDDHYDRIRLSFSPLSTDHLTQNFTVMAEADPVIYNESYAPSDAIIEIDGPRNNPRISIGGVEYGANIELAEGHRLVIDTVEHTVRDYSSEYAFSNVYSARSEGAFEKIERGENAVYWDGQQTVRIKLYQQRSIPKWN